MAELMQSLSSDMGQALLTEHLSIKGHPVLKTERGAEHTATEPVGTYELASPWFEWR